MWDWDEDATAGNRGRGEMREGHQREDSVEGEASSKEEVREAHRARLM